MSSNRHERTPAPHQRGIRLDLFLVEFPGVGSRRRARQAIASGKVQVDGIPCGPQDKGRLLAEGCRVSLNWDRPGTSRAHTNARRSISRAGLTILYDDAHLIAVDKPAGLLTDTATRRQARERDCVRARLQELLSVDRGRVHIVHRLDADTSGVVLAAKTEQAAGSLRRQFANQRPERVYLTILQGVPDPPAGEWSDWMAWDARRLRQIVSQEGRRGAVLARARYRTLAVQRGLALVEVRLVSGRRNQIRLHAQLREIPLLGEKIYLPQDWRRRGATLSRQALHALSLRVLHPVRRKPIGFRAPLPQDMQALATRLGLQGSSG